MKTDSYSRLLAQRLSNLTKKANMPLMDLAHEIGISVGALSNYQNGKAEPGLTALCAIADYFEVPVDWLIGRSQVRDPKAEEAGVCEYLRLSHDAVRFLRDLSDGAQTEQGRVQMAEVSNWLFDQEEFQTLLLSIWFAVSLIGDEEEHKLDAGFQKHLQEFVQSVRDPKYVAMSALVHLLDDRVEDYLEGRKMGTTTGAASDRPRC